MTREQAIDEAVRRRTWGGLRRDMSISASRGFEHIEQLYCVTVWSIREEFRKIMAERQA